MSAGGGAALSRTARAVLGWIRPRDVPLSTLCSHEYLCIEVVGGSKIQDLGER